MSSNVINLVNYLESNTAHLDVACLKTVKKSKTLNAHLERYKSGRFEKNEINALLKLFTSYRFADNQRKLEIEALQELILNYVDGTYVYSNHAEIMHFPKACKISREQTEFGKQWLKNYFFKKDGKPRSGKATEDIGEHELKIAKAVSRFEFVGILLIKNQWGDVNGALPIYRTYNRKGEYFDYSPIHWGQPVIMVGF